MAVLPHFGRMGFFAVACQVLVRTDAWSTVLTVMTAIVLNFFTYRLIENLSLLYPSRDRLSMSSALQPSGDIVSNS